MLKLLNMCLFFNCKKCFSSVGTGTPYMMIWDCCLPLSHAPADARTHLQSDGQNGIELIVPERDGKSVTEINYYPLSLTTMLLPFLDFRFPIILGLSIFHFENEF